ncbi:MAG: hypothetical protein ABEN55_23450 [Bradymonadaceae bacterium]
MGEYYEYVNFERRERFSVGLFGDGITRSVLGHTLGARGLSLLTLVTTESHRDAERVGSWAGDPIATVGDQINIAEPPGLESPLSVEEPDGTSSNAVYRQCRDLTSAVLVMLLRHDGPRTYADKARENDFFFGALAELVLTHDQPDVRFLLDEYVDDWRKRAGQLRKERYIDVPPP